MRKQFFRQVDSVLPRWLARIPYDVALWSLRLLIGLGLHSKVWNRNSTRLGTFIFGVSDLDVTVVSKGELSFDFFRHALTAMKRFFVFLGETNLYQLSHVPFVMERINPYELKRDPELLERFPVEKRESDALKFVFIARMLFSDVFTLKADPALRQLKWKDHFDLIGFDYKNKFIDLDFVISALKELCHHNERICQSLDLWKDQVFTEGLDVYHAPLGDGFRIMAPHCSLWFHFRDDGPLLKGMNEFEREIFKAQIDWEFWGLYTQRYHLNNAQVREHFARLQRAHAVISTEEEVKKLKRELEISF